MLQKFVTSVFIKAKCSVFRGGDYTDEEGERYLGTEFWGIKIPPKGSGLLVD